MRYFPESRVRAIFDLADIGVLNLWQLPNGYWNCPEANKESPWWLVKTPLGLIRIGWRKRVISIDWNDTGIRKLVTKDDVTKDLGSVHAWSDLKAIEYLKTLAEQPSNT